MGWRKVINVLAGIAVIVLVAALFKTFSLAAPAAQTKYDPAKWGAMFPLQYKSYLKNYEIAPSPTGFGGNVNIQKSEKEPELLMNFKGMPFSKDYAYRRGHPYALQDLKESKRVGPQTTGTCMTCKSADLIDIYKDMGDGYAKKPLSELLPRMQHSITCASCHDEKLKLRVSNPAFIQALERRKIDISKASRKEMQGYVCGQCHSTYFVEPEGKKVVFPWDKGLLPEEMYSYYKEKPYGFEQDWVHPDSKVKALKARHPDYETWISGTHGLSGVTCVDCHMPRVKEGAKTYTSHWVTSPMKRIEESCGPCHKQDSKWLLTRVKTIQGNSFQLQRIAGQTIARAHGIIGKASQVKGVNMAELDQSRELLRKAQLFWDLVAAENGVGFHNASQCENTLGQAIDLAHRSIEGANRAAGKNF